jgi:hypothetical protein
LVLVEPTIQLCDCFPAALQGRTTKLDCVGRDAAFLQLFAEMFFAGWQHAVFDQPRILGTKVQDLPGRVFVNEFRRDIESLIGKIDYNDLRDIRVKSLIDNQAASDDRQDRAMHEPGCDESDHSQGSGAAKNGSSGQ